MPAISNFHHLIFPIFYSAQHIRAASCIQPTASVRADVLSVSAMPPCLSQTLHRSAAGGWHRIKTALDHMAESSRLLRLRHFLEFYMLCLSLSQNAFFFVENHHILNRFFDFLYTQNFRIFHKMSGAFFHFNALFYTYSLCKLNEALLSLVLHYLVSLSKIKYCSQAAANMYTI